MRAIKLTLAAVLLILTVLWLLARTLVPAPFTCFTFRAALVQYTGVITMATFSVAMVLALRPKWLGPHLGGLDKMYRLHKWLGITGLAAVYLVLAYHTFVPIEFDYWSQPVGWAVALLTLAGVFAAVIVLLGRIGAGRKVDGVIESLIPYPELNVLETAIRIQGNWPGHKAGQFAFVTSSKAEGAHPFTIASAWDPDERRIVFITKALGDYTSKLREMLQVGMPVTVEGPYGRFDFEDARPRQIWIGAGIGITPFVARMKQLAKEPGRHAIDLFHPTADYSEEAIGKLTADARAANVRLHVLVSPRDGLLNGERIRAEVPEWRSASIWFCDPPGFGRALRDDFAAQGFPAADFRQELFQMR